VVNDDLDVVRVSRPPAKTDSPLLVDPNAVLAGPVSLELLQAVARRQSQVIEYRRCVQHKELTERDLLYVRTQLPHGAALEQTLGVAVTEALDHKE